MAHEAEEEEGSLSFSTVNLADQSQPLDKAPIKPAEFKLGLIGATVAPKVRKNPLKSKSFQNKLNRIPKPTRKLMLNEANNNSSFKANPNITLTTAAGKENLSAKPQATKKSISRPLMQDERQPMHPISNNIPHGSTPPECDSSSDPPGENPICGTTNDPPVSGASEPPDP